MLRIALTLSTALHVALGVWVEVRGSAHPELAPVVDSWTGPGIEVDTVASETSPASPTGVSDVSSPPADARSGAEPAEASAPARDEPAATVVTPKPHRSVPAKARLASLPTSATPVATASNDSATSASSDAPATSASGTSASSAADFGAAGLPLGVRHLPTAFTRALGLASRGDPRWLTLPAGPVGEARVLLNVDEAGQLGELEYESPDVKERLAPVVEHLLENTRLLLMSGHFSLDPTRARAGIARLRVRVEITEQRTDADPAADPEGLSELEYEPPNGAKPGRGSFRLNSGRRVIGWVYVE